MRKSGRSLRRFTLIACTLPLGLAPIGCSTNPATGRTQWDVLSRSEEIELGRAAAGELVDGYGGRVEAQALQGYCERVGAAMTPHTEADYPSLPWEFTLLDTDVINAFALPGGKVFISRGLASKLENEAQLAGILGHEIGHVTAEHADKRVGNQIALSLGVSLAAVAVSGADEEIVRVGVPVLVGTGGQLFALRFSRQEELEADRLGMRYMTRAGYNPRAQLGVMQILASESGERQTPEFLSTHPYPKTRVEHIRDLLRNEYRSAEQDPALEFHEARFESEFLRPLRAYAASRPLSPTSDRPLALSDPSGWCGVCAADASGGSGGSGE